MSDELDPTILAKWLANRLEPADRQLLAEWLAADPAREAQLEELREIWRMAGAGSEARPAAADPAEAARWTAIVGKLRETEALIPPFRASAPTRTIAFPFVRQRPSIWSWATAAAAAVLLAVGAALWAATDRSRRAIAETSPLMRAYETVRGERAEFRLRDGTRVMLSVASRLRVPANFGDRDRTVFLSGTAYFDVAHDVTRPFVVHGGDVIAQDLGTEFVITAYPEDEHARVVVRSGRVALRAAASADTAAAKTLEPGEAGRLDSAGRAVVQPADTAADFAWTGGTLVLDGMPLRQALPQLARWFDLDFQLSDSSLGRIPVAATLTNRPTGEALGFIATALGLRAVQRGQVVTFYRGRHK